MLDDQVQSYIIELRKRTATVNSAIVISSAEGIVKRHDSNLLRIQVNGGHVVFTKYWAQNLLVRMGFRKRKASTTAKVSVTDFVARKEQFLFDIHVLRELEQIPEELVINWDHTGLNYVPVSNWTMEREGAKRVEIGGINDKRQITAVFAGTMKGDFLPPQVIYQGKTPKCLPAVVFPNDWHITCTINHWANEVTTKDYINKILLPYIDKKRKALGKESPALVIFDRFKGQCMPAVLSLLEENNIRIAVVPANCTDRLQPLDISMNKSVKEFLRRQFQTWYANQVKDMMEKEIENGIVDLKMSVMKPLGARWLMGAYDYIKSKPDIVINGFRGAEIIH